MADETFTKADLDKAIQEAVEAAVSEAKAGLETKNKALLNELKEARKSATITPEQLAAVEDERDKARADLVAAQKAAKDAAKAAETATKALEAESGFTRKLLVENGLKDTLIKGGVKDEDFLDALVTKFSQGASIVSEGDVRKAMVGDKELSAVVTEYLGSDAGKKFVAAPVNSGGGALGSKGGEGGKTVARPTFDAMSQQERATFAKEGGKVVDQAA